MREPKYKRVLLKISGEALAGDAHRGLDFAVIGGVCDVIRQCVEAGVQVGGVGGGGNFWRGVKDGGGKMERTRADHMGMLATVINALAVADCLEQRGVEVRVQTAIAMIGPAYVYCMRSLKGGADEMMTIIWIAAIIIFGIAEAATAGLVSIWFVAGAVAALVATELGAALWLQFATFLVVSILALTATRPLARKMLDKTIVPTNADRVLHHEAKVTETVDNENATGAVYIDGKTWTARSDSGEIIEKGKMAKIVRMEGVKLYVRPARNPGEK